MARFSTSELAAPTSYPDTQADSMTRGRGQPATVAAESRPLIVPPVDGLHANPM